ncbi:hypothetical protein NUW54_g14505 [Trametes sanguinea]|uniref:Uncharacterized protein n=1 Tax=Trametes sanguinea TaxID=158606 RepID=A0ACC1ME07_9APHY|nr:hypothetical protein NUW54_g14505 [Trametes sanguinea]
MTTRPRRERLRVRKTAGRQQQVSKAPPQASLGGTGSQGRDGDHGGDDDNTQQLPTSPLERYSISQTRRVPVQISKWLIDHREDPATKNFIPLLRSHIFGRLMDRRDHDEFTPGELDRVHIDTDKIYSRIHRISAKLGRITRHHNLIRQGSIATCNELRQQQPSSTVFKVSPTGKSPFDYPASQLGFAWWSSHPECWSSTGQRLRICNEQHDAH